LSASDLADEGGNDRCQPKTVPFCGGEPELFDSVNGPPIHCPQCNAVGPAAKYPATREQRIDEWNSRASDQQPQTRKEASQAGVEMQGGKNE
jgi:hypothetical protein